MVKVHQYRVKDPITGRRYLTRYKLSEEEAAERYPERERIDVTEESRTIYDETKSIPNRSLRTGQRFTIADATCAVR
jgi:hypothetical protein